ncbi:MAG: glutamine synthetase [Chloroflexi bacterium]|nr:glutamine synthetase [Chloroflexota bacterium]
MDAQTVEAQARNAGVRLVRFLYCDNGGAIRGKATHVNHLAERIHSGIGLTVAMQAMNMLDQLQDIPGMGAVGEIRLIPDPATFTLLPYAPHSATLLCDMVRLDHEPWAACPRSFLKRVLARAEDMGIRVLATFENEFMLARRRADGSAEPFDESLCFSSVGMANAAGVIDEIVLALEQQGISVEQYYPELGHGQQEMPLSPAWGVRAADQQVLFRETARGVAARYGLVASLAPKPFPDQAGNGCHIHFSLWDLSQQRNLLYEASDRFGLSETAYHFMGGVLSHLPALVALTCPSFNSYRRLKPRMWSSAYTCWGPDNREGAIRVPSLFWGSESNSANLELKSSDPSSNPYLALGGLIAAGLDGIARRASPGEATHVDPDTLSAEERERRGIRRLPTSLGEALGELERDEVLLDALGEPLSRAYLTVKRSEWEAFRQQDVAFELKHHFEKF